MKSNYFIYIIIFLFVVMIISAYSFNDAFKLCIGSNGTCTDIKIPNFGGLFVMIFSFIISILMGFWRFFIIKEKNDDINKKVNNIKNKSVNIKEKENFAESLYSYINLHESKLDIPYIKSELLKINKNIFIEKLEESKKILREDIKETNNDELGAI